MNSTEWLCGDICRHWAWLVGERFRGTIQPHTGFNREEALAIPQGEWPCLESFKHSLASLRQRGFWPRRIGIGHEVRIVSFKWQYCVLSLYLLFPSQWLGLCPHEMGLIPILLFFLYGVAVKTKAIAYVKYFVKIHENQRHVSKSLNFM